MSFIAWERVSGEGIPEGFRDGAPTLAVEVVSPNERAGDIHARVMGYPEAGARQAWVLWPRRSAASFYHEEG